MDVDIDLDESLLQQVVGVAVAAQTLHEKTPDRLLVAVEQELERHGVAPDHPLGQRPVVRDDIVGYLHTRSSLRRFSTPSSSA